MKEWEGIPSERSTSFRSSAPKSSSSESPNISFDIFWVNSSLTVVSSWWSIVVSVTVCWSGGWREVDGVGGVI